MTALPLRLESLEDDDPWIIEQKTFDILNSYLQPCSTMSALAAAQGIDALTPAKRPDQGDGKEIEEAESYLWETWGTFIEIAKQIPCDHVSMDRLVELVNSLSSLPPTIVTVWTANLRLWTDLPLLGPSMREAWLMPTYRNAQPTAEAAQQWISLSSFAARLLNHEMVSWTSFAVWQLREALEEPSTGPKLQCDIAAAAEWIVHSGVLLYSSRSNDEVDPKDRSVMAGSIYKGKWSLCPERWEFWKLRFGEISNEVGGDTKKTAVKAMHKMTAIEQERGA
ncbi:hypothetical protein LTR66_003915 [Elasticomyces elasticus]|nr:hypothetical protein LTR28_006573 [Elasticomyces elasticus]KAK4984106.1 hypothetical protein LTR50_006793 [Elasticomyces elasticus]KAK4996478.1 hypothetical protein LTR66_003915 [Elasticomyces elasticus]